MFAGRREKAENGAEKEENRERRKGEERGTEGIFREVQCWKFKLELNVLEIDCKIGECFMIGD